MNIVIVGDGKVGFTLAEYLSQEPHDVTMVDRNPVALSKASDTLDVMCVRGNGANVRTLIEAGAGEADVLIAVTTSDEINMVCCLMGKKLGAKYVIARIRDPEYTDNLQLLQREMDIDMIINPERAAAYEIARLFRYPFAMNIETFAHGRVEMVEFRIEKEDELSGVSLVQFSKKFSKVLCCAVERDGQSIIPRGDFTLRLGDKLHVAGELVSVTQLFKRLGRNMQRVRSAILVGGGHIAYYLAGIIEDMGVSLKIIEIKEEKCKQLSEALEHVTVVHGDGTERELLESESIQNTDSLVCLTDRDEENLITGLYGVKAGVPKVIVKVNRLNYLELVANLGVDSVVSPKYTTANTILRQVRALARSEGLPVEKVYRIMGGKVEAQEFYAPQSASYLNIPLSQLKIKQGVLVAMIVRYRKVIIPFGSDHIEANDSVVLVAETGRVMSIEDALSQE